MVSSVDSEKHRFVNRNTVNKRHWRQIAIKQFRDNCEKCMGWTPFAPAPSSLSLGQFDNRHLWPYLFGDTNTNYIVRLRLMCEIEDTCGSGPSFAGHHYRTF